MKNILLKFAIFLPLICSSQWTQIGQDLTGNLPYDFFGRSISMSSDGNTIAVGISGDDTSAISAGLVKVYQLTGGVWTQIGQDILGSASGNELGTAVSLSGDGTILAVGEPNSDSNGTDAGLVRVFEYIGNVWTQVGQDLIGEWHSNDSGAKIDLSNDGTIIAIASPGNIGDSVKFGQVEIYQNIAGTWTQMGQDLQAFTTFQGIPMEIDLSQDGMTVAIGCPYNNPIAYNSGEIFIYKYNGNVWLQAGQSLASNTAYDYWGFSLKLFSNGNAIAFGGRGGTDALVKNYIKIYEYNSNSWSQTGADIIGDRGFPTVDISPDGEMLILGTHSSLVSTKLFMNTNNVWSQIGSTIIPNNSNFDPSPSLVRIAADKNSFAISDLSNDENGTNSGKVRMYLIDLLSIEDSNLDNTVIVSPNPVTNVSEVKLGKMYDKIEVTLYNAVGKLIIKENYISKDTIQINTEKYTSGIYFLKVLADNKQATLKLIKK